MTLNPGVASLYQLTMIKVSARLWKRSDTLSKIQEIEIEKEEIVFHHILDKIASIPLPNSMRQQLELVAVEMGIMIIQWIRSMAMLLKRDVYSSETAIIQELLPYFCWTDFGRIDIVQTYRSAYYTHKFDENKQFLLEIHRLCIDDCIDDYWHRIMTENNVSYELWCCNSPAFYIPYLNYWFFKKTGCTLDTEYADQEKENIDMEMMTQATEDNNYVAMVYFLRKANDMIFYNPEFQESYLNRVSCLGSNDNYIDVHKCVYRQLFLLKESGTNSDLRDELMKKAVYGINLDMIAHWTWHHLSSSIIDEIVKDLSPKEYFRFFDRLNLILFQRYDILKRQTTHWDIFFTLWHSLSNDFKISHVTDIGLYVVGPLIVRGEIDLLAEVINDEAFVNLRVGLMNFTRFHWYRKIKSPNGYLFAEDCLQKLSFSDSEKTEIKIMLPLLSKFL